MQKRTAFSLVEISIVLVILGLLIGGVLSGQALIRSSALRSVISDYQKYLSAVQQFQNEFNALPGDMSNATTYWGVAHATAATCVTTQGNGTETCDGNGDGLIAASTGSQEQYRFWQHLANAGLITGTYTGVKSDTAAVSSSTANSPTSKINNGLWYVNNWGPLTANAAYFSGDYYNTFVFGAPVTNSWPNSPILRPEEAYGIDVKIDDGRPGLGKILGHTPALCSDGTYLTAATANYLLTSKTTNCSLFAPNALYRSF